MNRLILSYLSASGLTHIDQVKSDFSLHEIESPLAAQQIGAHAGNLFFSGRSKGNFNLRFPTNNGNTRKKISLELMQDELC